MIWYALITQKGETDLSQNQIQDLPSPHWVALGGFSKGNFKLNYHHLYRNWSGNTADNVPALTRQFTYINIKENYVSQLSENIYYLNLNISFYFLFCTMHMYYIHYPGTIVLIYISVWWFHKPMWNF